MKSARQPMGATLTALTAALLAGCGVPPTGVLDGGKAADGLTKGLRLYFVSSAGRLEAVARPDMPADKVTDPNGVIKLLVSGPTPAERESGLTTLLMPQIGYQGTVNRAGAKDAVTVRVPWAEVSTSGLGNRNLAGQLVCSIARARAMADDSGTTWADDIPVTVQPQGGRSGTYVCSDFLT
ncbi:hypothetical protein [Streptomyces zagrosensis]|uniref:Lipoprotein n=1 Tax=Streptomyces zagrosensis TaxID=1042984 RepID=A0A7W9Q7H1_9ACTN|nr:hypothetical protein [Streptomyces zagrosensis]MBB5935015.1 hypothetical protein [Streptomyces zagrosensis]